MDPHLPSKIRERLLAGLPGEQAQFQMAPHYRNRVSFSGAQLNGYRKSAVMILLCCRNNSDWFFPLTLRQQYAGVHSAQVSLPGGKADSCDLTLADTALRECYEEIGLRNNIEIAGELSPLHIPVSRFIVHPFIGINHVHDFSYQSHEREVKSIIETPLQLLVDDRTAQTGEIFLPDDQIVKTPYFLVEGHKVWGATAMILSELKAILKDVL